MTRRETPSGKPFLSRFSSEPRTCMDAIGAPEPGMGSCKGKGQAANLRPHVDVYAGALCGGMRDGGDGRWYQLEPAQEHTRGQRVSTATASEPVSHAAEVDMRRGRRTQLYVGAWRNGMFHGQGAYHHPGDANDDGGGDCCSSTAGTGGELSLNGQAGGGLSFDGGCQLSTTQPIGDGGEGSSAFPLADS
mmetsp:Transcript_12761/g.31019  ORF Transcript_12761/g.31019 Transcript_12761/m.31019 type:complete len:190 (+) Transcript_12761:397-966(+)